MNGNQFSVHTILRPKLQIEFLHFREDIGILGVRVDVFKLLRIILEVEEDRLSPSTAIDWIRQFPYAA